MRPIGSAALDCSEAVPECIRIAWGSTLSLLTGHKIPVYLSPILVLTGVSSLRESHSSGIRFVPGIFIRFHGSFYSSKVMAKLQNSLLLSSGYTC
jgi:hypothetical protein